MKNSSKRSSISNNILDKINEEIEKKSTEETTPTEVLKIYEGMYNNWVLKEILSKESPTKNKISQSYNYKYNKTIHKYRNIVYAKCKFTPEIYDMFWEKYMGYQKMGCEKINIISSKLWKEEIEVIWTGKLARMWIKRLHTIITKNKWRNKTIGYLQNPDLEKIKWTDEKIVNDVTQLNPIKVSKIEAPTSTQDVIDILKNTTWPVSVWGGRFSMWGQTASHQSTHLDMRWLNQVINFNKEQKTIKVWTWIRWCDIQRHIDKHNLSVSIMQTYANFTVWGSLSVNVHGRYVWLGPIISSVKSINIVLADGTLKHASREENKEIFFGAIGWYNALWVIVEAELQLTENTVLKRVNKKMSTQEYKDYFMKNVIPNKKAIFHNGHMYPPHYNSINAVTWEETNEEPTTKTRLAPASKNHSLEKMFFWAFSELSFWKQLREKIVDPLQFRWKKIHYRNYEAWYNAAELEPHSRKKSTYVLLEYFVPVNKFEDFKEKMASIYENHDVNVINVSIRHAYADTESYMSWAKEEVFAFVVYYKQKTHEVEKNKVATWTKELADAALSVNGSYYLPYQAHATTEQFHKAYPKAK